ncbi:GDP-mannose 4,6-dehydratase [Thermodesulfovibrionales bacterium]|nr:GDP-mannose 4,6-dehydratase [Thermodesulfovibrionales bacterium]
MILVTGGAGFIGSHLIDRLLVEGHEVLCLDNFNDFYDPRLKEKNVAESLKHPAFSLIRGNILDVELLGRIFREHNIDKVVHLSALAGVRPSIVSPAMYVDIDIKGTVNLLEKARGNGVNQFVFGSSSSVYGVTKKIPFSEDDSTDFQVSPYATAKKAGELYCKTYHHLYGIPITILRFFTVYGPRQRPDMAICKFTDLMINGKPIPMFGDGRSERDYTYIDDCIDGIMAAVGRPFDFEVFNIGNSTTVKLKDLLALIAKKLGVNPKIDQLPEQPGDVPITCADISRAKELIGYNPSITIEEGIDRFITFQIHGSRVTGHGSRVTGHDLR